jgi:MraZ protein
MDAKPSAPIEDRENNDVSAEESARIATLLLGTEEATIDDRGRILVAKRKRDGLGESFVLSIGKLGCLCAYPVATWSVLMAEIDACDPNDPNTERYERLMCGEALGEIRFDAQFRFLVPQKMRDVSKLKDKVFLVGCRNRVEVWSKSEHEEFTKNPETYQAERRQRYESAYNLMKGRPPQRQG